MLKKNQIIKVAAAATDDPKRTLLGLIFSFIARWLCYVYAIIGSITVSMLIVLICLVISRGQQLISSVNVTEMLRKMHAGVEHDCTNSELRFSIQPHGEYWVLMNYVIGEATRKAACGDYVTLVTYGRERSVFQHLPMLVSRWLGPISIAIFAPGYDFNRTLQAINYLRHCTHTDEKLLIREFVTFHIYFPKGHIPVEVPNTEEKVLTSFKRCEDYKWEEYDEEETYTTKNNLVYSANMAQNIALEAVNTMYVLECDLTFIPSVGLWMTFLNETNNSKQQCETANVCTKTPPLTSVYVIPVAQLERETKPPETVEDLTELLKTGVASRVETGVNLFISHKFRPRADERMEWFPNKWPLQAQWYALCLSQYKARTFEEGFFVVYPNTTAYSLLNDEVLTPAQEELMKIIEAEYPLVYGNAAEHLCNHFTTIN